MDSFVVSTVSRAPRIIDRGTAHAAMIFTDLLRKERTSSQPENRLRFGHDLGCSHARSCLHPRQESRVGQNGNGGAAGSDASHGDSGSSTAGSEVALDAGTTSRARDAFSLIYEETIDAVFAIESALEPLAGPPAPLPWEIKGLRKAQASSPAAAGYRRAGKTSCAAMMSDLYQRFQMSNPYQRDEVACGAPQDKFPVHTDTNPISKPENAFEAAAEEAARAAGSSQIACGSSQIACGSSQIAAGSSQIAW